MSGLINIGEMGALALHVVTRLADIREQDPQARVTVQQLAAGFNASIHTLHKVVRRLVMAGFLEGTRGANGGLRLVIPPENITLRVILEEVEGRLGCNGCLFSQRACPTDQDCPFHMLAGDLEDQILTYFSKNTIADLQRMNRSVVTKSGVPWPG